MGPGLVPSARNVCAQRASHVNAPRVRGPGIASEGAGLVPSARMVLKGKDSGKLGPLIVLDSGASVSLHPFPAEWNGKPPAGGQWGQVHLAVGTTWTYTLDGMSYANQADHPEGTEVDPLIPWGRDARRHNPVGDLNWHSADPHAQHVPSGLKVPVIWRGDLPHLYAKHYEDLKLAHRVNMVNVSKFRPELLSRAAAVMEAVAKHSRDHLKQFIMKNATEVQLEAPQDGAPDVHAGMSRLPPRRHSAEAASPPPSPGETWGGVQR